MKQRELAFLYLQKAAEDEALIAEVLESPHISDAIIGFHCQQAAEKLLKALLSYNGIRFRKTHDVLELIDLLIDNGYNIPEHLLGLDEFTPYTVECRYELFPLEEIQSWRSWIEAHMKA
jgi:HEPN domain-containing protein